MSAEQVSGNNQGYRCDKRCDEHLPRPQIALEEEGYGREGRGNDATDDLGSEVEDDARHETAHTAEQALIGAVTLWKHIRKPHG